MNRTTIISLFFVMYVGFNCQADDTLQMDIVVNSSVPKALYTRNGLFAIFSMYKKRWSDGSKIHVFVLPDNNPNHQLFLKMKLNLFPHQLRRIWDRLVFSGIGSAPIEVASMKEMEYMISKTPGAIGYLDRKPNKNNVRVLDYE